MIQTFRTFTGKYKMLDVIYYFDKNSECLKIIDFNIGLRVTGTV
jgi:hypothetical protein